MTIVPSERFYVFVADLDLEGTRHASSVVVYSFQDSIDVQALYNEVRPHLSGGSDLETLLLLQPKGRQADAAATAARIRDMFGFAGLNVGMLSVTDQGKIEVNPGSSPNLVSPRKVEKLGNAIFEAGLQQLYDSSATVMRSAPGFHFEGPGGKHLATFIRTGNMFSDSARTSFVACALLSRLDVRSIDTVLTDTASINALGYELVRLAQIFVGHSSGISVGSLAGYSGLSAAPPISRVGIVVLISVSFTGNYANRIRSRYPNASVVSIVAINPFKSRRAYLLAPYTGAREGLIDRYAKSWADCERCHRRNESVVQIDGDQLIPLAPTIQSRLITGDQGKEWMPAQIEALIRLGAPVVQVETSPSDAAIREVERPGSSWRAIYLDVERFFTDVLPKPSATPAIEALRMEFVDKSAFIAGFRPTHIVGPADAATHALIDHISTSQAPDAKVFDKAHVDDLVADAASIRSSRVLVVMAVSSSGRTLSEISKALRRVLSDRGAEIAYFVFVARALDPLRWRHLSSTLTSGEGKTDRATVTQVVKIYLPGDRLSVDSVWTAELEFWSVISVNLLYRDDEAGAEMLRQVDARVLSLKRGGLRDDLFLSSSGDINGPSGLLQLQPNFMWWSSFEYKAGDVSQAAIFMCFMGVLEATRGQPVAPEATARPMPPADIRAFDTAQHSHNIQALHPLNFDRYDDGVTQSALLRSALPHELDYASSPSLSAAMLDVLLRVVDEFLVKPDESALVEFLLSIAMGRLRIRQRQLHYFLAYLPEEVLPPVAILLREEINALLSTDDDEVLPLPEDPASE